MSAMYKARILSFYLLVVFTFLATNRTQSAGLATSTPTSELVTAAPTTDAEPCVVTLHFSNSGYEGVWLPNVTHNGQMSYTLTTEHMGPQNPGSTHYLYWIDVEKVTNPSYNSSFWYISENFGETGPNDGEYICFEYKLTKCINGRWKYYQYYLSSWQDDEDAFTMMDSDCEFTCIPHVETLNFDDSTLDGT